MSVVLQSLSDTAKPPILYCKGADDTMLARMSISDNEKEDVEKHLYEFAVEGLRTLVLARKVLTQEEADDYEKK